MTDYDEIIRRLREAKDKISKPNQWTKQSLWRMSDEDGSVCYCAWGAVRYSKPLRYDVDVEVEVLEALKSAISVAVLREAPAVSENWSASGFVAWYNDLYTTTHDDIMRLYETAILEQSILKRFAEPLTEGQGEGRFIT